MGLTTSVAKTRSRRGLLVTLATLAVGVAVCFASALETPRLQPGAPGPGASDLANEHRLQLASTSAPASAPAPAATRPHTLPGLVRSIEACANADPVAEREDRVQRARDAIGLLRAQLATTRMNSTSNDLGAFSRVMGPYVKGWCDSISRTAVDLVEELAAETEARLCDPEADPAELAVIAGVVQQMPELGSAHSVDCMTERDTEHVALDTETLLRRKSR